jgi:hypothetical protein
MRRLAYLLLLVVELLLMLLPMLSHDTHIAAAAINKRSQTPVYYRAFATLVCTHTVFACKVDLTHCFCRLSSSTIPFLLTLCC